MRDKIQHFRKEMRKFRSRRDVYGVGKYNEARGEFLKLLERQEVYWKQRLKQFWLKEGDQNTKFFHKYASGRKKTNQLLKLKDKHGVWHEDRESIKGIITNYFVEMFQSTMTTGALSEREKVSQVTEEQNTQLMLPITCEEVKQAVFLMYPEKAPGCDGLNPCFYQAYWTVVGEDVVNFCKRFFISGELPLGINRTLVCLIPKIKQPQQMQDMRPISLCNVLFRILSKVMANRLKTCLPCLISEKQSAFVEGRLLTDNALAAFELNHFIRRKTQGKRGVAGVKLDISKAYDRLEWPFLEGMLLKFGFNSVWVERVMKCVQTVSYSFVHEGCEFGDIQPKRGIRQGDPISPYLYILCAEGLSSIIRRNEEAGLIHGISIARGAPSISHLLFANDCYVFFRATEQEARAMRSILERYEKMSGQAINLMKSIVTFSPNTTTECRQKICDVLHVQETMRPGKYLGLPMQIGKNKNSEFKFLADRVSQKLQGWSQKSLSKGGKVVLLKTAAQTIPNFWMNLFLIPQEVCTTIQRQMNAMWWGNGGGSRGIRWLSWERLCEDKKMGGLGFKDLRKFNIAMLAKQGWRLLNGDNPMVTQMMKAKYYPHTNFLEAKIGSNPSFMWRSILESQGILKQGVRRRIGDGVDTYVWKVPWLPCVENGYVTTTMPQELEQAKVAGLMQENKNGWEEEILRDIFNDRDRELISRIPVSVNVQNDSWFWLFDQTGQFTVKSCYRKLVGEQTGLQAQCWKKLWSLDLPGKVTNFIWRACRAVVPTATALAEKRVQIDVKCSWCRLFDESIEHVLFGCSFAREVWLRVGIQEESIQRSQESVKEILFSLFSTCTKEKLSWIAILCWSLWNRGNRWVWDKVSGSVFGVHAAATNLMNDWRKSQEEKVSSRPVANQVARQWSPPPCGWLKVNIDAAIFAEMDRVGVSCVIRNEGADFICARAHSISAILQPREAEAVGLKEALSWAKELGFKNCIFETDAKMLADACIGVNGRSFFHTIVLDCVDLFKHFDNVLVQYVNRSANVVAHTLARATHSMSDVQEWFDVTPDIISDVLLLDSI